GTGACVEPTTVPTIVPRRVRCRAVAASQSVTPATISVPIERAPRRRAERLNIHVPPISQSLWAMRGPVDGPTPPNPGTYLTRGFGLNQRRCPQRAPRLYCLRRGRVA